MTASSAPLPSAERPATGANGAPVHFELERFDVTDGRIEVEGRWFGVRGLRFMRPTLLLRSPDGERPLLALLEHKPWAAEDGARWVAAFPSAGGKADAARAQLAVAPSVVVPLAPRGAPRPRPDPLEAMQERLAAQERRVAQLEADLAALAEEREAALAERDKALARDRDAVVKRDEALRELQGLREAFAIATREHDEAVGVGEQAHTKLKAAAKQRDATRARHERLVGELEETRTDLQRALRDHQAAVEARDEAIVERDAAARERRRVANERKAIAAERKAATRERDGALRERNALRTELERATRELEGARRQLDAVRRQLRDRDDDEPSTPLLSAPGGRPDRHRPAAGRRRRDVPARVIATVALVLFLVVVFVLVRSI